MGAPGCGELSPFFYFVFDGALFGPQGCPRAAPGSPRGAFFIDFGRDLSTFRAPGDAFLKVLASICAPHTAQNRAEYRVKNFPGNPVKQNAIAVPSERCTDDAKNQAEYHVKNFPGNPEEKKRESCNLIYPIYPIYHIYHIYPIYIYPIYPI